MGHSSEVRYTRPYGLGPREMFVEANSEALLLLFVATPLAAVCSGYQGVECNRLQPGRTTKGL